MPRAVVCVPARTVSAVCVPALADAAGAVAAVCVPARADAAVEVSVACHVAAVESLPSRSAWLATSVQGQRARRDRLDHWGARQAKLAARVCVQHRVVTLMKTVLQTTIRILAPFFFF